MKLFNNNIKTFIIGFVFILIFLIIIGTRIIDGTWKYFIFALLILLLVFLILKFIGEKYPNSKIWKFCIKILKVIGEFIFELFFWI